MNLSPQEKGVIAILVLAGIIAAILAFLGGRLIAGQSQAAASSPGSTATTQAATQTAMQATNTVAITVPAGGGAAPVEIVDQKVTPATPDFGQEITFTARIKGEPETVYMYFGPAGGDIGGSHRLPMTKGGATDGITTWTVKTNAIQGFGENHQCYYTASAITSDGIEVRYGAGQNGPPQFTVNK